MKQYLKSRPVASAESTRRIKEDAVRDALLKLRVHSIFAESQGSINDVGEIERQKLIHSLHSYKPQLVRSIDVDNHDADNLRSGEERPAHRLRSHEVEAQSPRQVRARADSIDVESIFESGSDREITDAARR